MSNQPAGKVLAKLKILLFNEYHPKLEDSAKEFYKKTLAPSHWQLTEDGSIGKIPRSEDADDFVIASIELDDEETIKTLNCLQHFFKKGLNIAQLPALRLKVSLQMPEEENELFFWDSEGDTDMIRFDKNGTFFETVRSMWEATSGVLE